MEKNKQGGITYDKEGKILNLGHCPYCGEIREKYGKGATYYCSKTGESFKTKDLKTTRELLASELKKTRIEENEYWISEVHRAFKKYEDSPIKAEIERLMTEMFSNRIKLLKDEK